ncbi:response regulator transcription factor [Sphingomonas edaphi]|uniref:DNA-binding response regulator n=1 Tax=Sphingomonas edaphi TaxID=2315689 RepID=A0A418PYI2_9SPHN|nr:response regulator [Sphingomonas edaphi]RIX27045.1 DNA-binding response regulator [Sphingomonas edaphi]
MSGRVFVVDDNVEMCRSLEIMLEACGYCVKSFNDPDVFLAARTELDPGVVLLDLRMPERSGLDVLNEMKDGSAGLPTVVITGHGRIDVAVKAIKLGAKDFIQKPFAEEELLTIIERELADIAQAQPGNTPASNEALANLTPRERQVVMALAEGKPNKVIAHELDLSVRTVEMHRARAMNRLNCRTFADLLRTVLDEPKG